MGDVAQRHPNQPLTVRFAEAMRVKRASVPHLKAGHYVAHTMMAGFGYPPKGSAYVSLGELLLKGDSPNADLMAQFLRQRDGQTFQSIPVVAFYTRDFKRLHIYIEFLAVYHKDRLVGAIHAPKSGESEQQVKERLDRECMEMPTVMGRPRACGAARPLGVAVHSADARAGRARSRVRHDHGRAGRRHACHH